MIRIVRGGGTSCPRGRDGARRRRGRRDRLARLCPRGVRRGHGTRGTRRRVCAGRAHRRSRGVRRPPAARLGQRRHTRRGDSRPRRADRRESWPHRRRRDRRPPDADKRRGAARLAVALALLLGFLLAVGTSLRDGPVSRTHLRALRRTLVIGSASVVGGCGSSASLRRSPQRCSRSPSSCPAPERPPPPRGLARRDRGLRRLRVRDLGSTTSL